MTYRNLIFAAAAVFFSCAIASPAVRADTASIQAGCSSVAGVVSNGSGTVVGSGNCGLFGGSDSGGTVASGTVSDFDTTGDEFVLKGTTALPVNTVTTPNACGLNCTDVQDNYGAGGSLQVEEFSLNGSGPSTGFILSGAFTGGSCLYSGVGEAVRPPGADLTTSCGLTFTGSTSDGQDWTGDFTLLSRTGSSDGSGTLNLQPTATPTPEPSSLLLFGSGLLLMAFMRRKIWAVNP